MQGISDFWLTAFDRFWPIAAGILLFYAVDWLLGMRASATYYNNTIHVRYGDGDWVDGERSSRHQADDDDDDDDDEDWFPPEPPKD